MKKIGLVRATNYNGSPYQLRGCSYDGIKDLKNLPKVFGFDPSNIRFIMNGRCTGDQVKKILIFLRDQCESGDWFWDSFSGHGSQTAQFGSDESDRKTEIQCMNGFNWDDQTTWLHDEWFKQWLLGFKKGVKVLLKYDTCNSTDINKGGVSEIYQKDKRILPPEDILHELSRVVGEVNKIKGSGSPDQDIQILTACGEQQTSLDTVDDSGNPTGAFTDAIWKVWPDMVNNPLNYVINEANNIMAQKGYDQRCEVHGLGKNSPAFNY